MNNYSSMKVSGTGTKYWRKNDQVHRDDGPAVIHSNGTKEWYQSGKLHRTDGPAVERVNGTKYWFVKDTNITDWIKEQNISDNPTQEEQMYIMMLWG